MTFFLIWHKFYFYISKRFWQGQYLNFWILVVIALGPRRTYKYIFSKDNFWVDFIKLFLFLLQKCLSSTSSLFFPPLYLWLPISVGTIEIAGRVSRLEWENCLFFLRLLLWGSKVCLAGYRKEGAYLLGVLSCMDKQKRCPCDFSVRPEFIHNLRKDLSLNLSSATY